MDDAPYRQPRWLSLTLALLLAWPLLSVAGGRAFNTLVVVNTNAPDSIELGDYYADAHDIPSHQLCSLGLATNRVSLSSNEFQTLIYAPITNHIAAEELEGQIDYVVLCGAFPTRVNGSEGLTASLFYGFKNAPSYYEAGECNLPSYTSNAFYRSERTFRSADDWNATNGFIAFHLIASNQATAKLVVDRGAAAQASFPSSSIQLHNWGDEFRGIRERRYEGTQFSFLALPGLPASCTISKGYQIMNNETNVIGHHDGYGMGQIPYHARMNNTWMNGAYSDHLTSFGGRIANFTNNSSQSTVLDWMGIGATASYGTVDEPCTYFEKFPDPLMGFYYARGFTIGEAYAMSVEAPYQGLFAGDPLAAPFAAPPESSVLSHSAYSIVTGMVPIQVSAEAHDQGSPAAHLDLYVDGRFQTNVFNISPTVGNVLSIAVDGITNSTTVASSQTLFDAVSALAGAVNSNTNQIVTAHASADRLELVYKTFDHAGDNASVAASVAAGGTEPLTLGVGLAASHLVPSIYPARKRLFLTANPYSGGANAGDTVTCTLTLTNGTIATNIIVATQGESVRSVLERLRTAITNDATLMATNGVLYDRIARRDTEVWQAGTLLARTPGPDGAGILVDFTVSPVSPTNGLVTNYNFNAFMQDNPDDLRARASVLFHISPTNEVLDATATVDTTLLNDGLHVLDFVARDGTSVAAASRLSLPLIICNASPQLSLLGTNGVTVTNGEPASLSKGTDFGPVDQGKARTNTYSLYNNGTAPLSITGWSTNGSGANTFQITGLPPSIQVGGSSPFTVVFTPSTNESFHASLSIESDAILSQTNLLLTGTGVAYSLTVVSEQGTASPAVGIHTHLGGAVLTNTISAPAPSGGTQLVSTGWTLAGHDPVSGITTQLVMTVTNDAVLTWLWTTNFWLETSAGSDGSVDVTTGWQPGGISTQITATADPYYAFTNWTGSTLSTNNPLPLLIDAPKSVQANFTARLATNDTPQWWLAQYGWTNDFDAAATNDIDMDGYFTWQEYIADTSPTNADSFFPPLKATGSRSNLQFEINPTSTGRHYYVDVGTPITNANWTPLTNALGNGGSWIPALTSPGPGFYFYRARVSLPP